MPTKAAVTTTERLVLREFDESDAPALYRLNSDPEVLRYTGDAPFVSEKASRAFIRGYDHYQRHGFGRWAVERVSDGTFIGFCGLARDEDSGEVDLGFRFFRDCWAKGYATEAGAAALRVGFEDLGLDEIVGRALRENLPSITVLQKLGMRFQSLRERGGLLWLVYGIDRERFEREAADSDQA